MRGPVDGHGPRVGVSLFQSILGERSHLMDRSIMNEGLQRTAQLLDKSSSGAETAGSLLG